MTILCAEYLGYIMRDACTCKKKSDFVTHMGGHNMLPHLDFFGFLEIVIYRYCLCVICVNGSHITISYMYIYWIRSSRRDTSRLKA